MEGGVALRCEWGGTISKHLKKEATLGTVKNLKKSMNHAACKNDLIWLTVSRQVVRPQLRGSWGGRYMYYHCE